MVTDPKYSYDRFDTTGARVGQAVADILENRRDEVYSAEEIIEGFSKDYLDWIREIAEVHKNEFEGPFYIFTVMNKVLGQLGVDNVLQNNFRVRKTKPLKEAAMEMFPSHTKTLFKVDVRGGEIKLVWTLPGWSECKSILKNPSLYDHQLVDSIRGCMGALGSNS